MEISPFLTQISSLHTYQVSAVASHVVTKQEVSEVKRASPKWWWRRRTSFSPLQLQSNSTFASLCLLFSLHLLHLFPSRCCGSEAVH